MRLTRGRFLAGLASALSLAGCTEVTRRLTSPTWPVRFGEAEAAPNDPDWRALNRIAFGPRPGDLERLRDIGLDAWIEEQLAPERIEENPAAWARLLPLDTLEMDASDARDFETATFPEVGRGQAALELQQACVLRAVYSARQLQEVMVEFWTDHFNISQLKGECSWLKTVDDRSIRRHALGRFRDLLFASARSPAMLFYLDNDRNRKRDPKTGAGPNENYARELLELHTLGVDGGYTLRDVQEVARRFTGWSYKRGLEMWPGEFVFRPEWHDDGGASSAGGRRLLLGRALPPAHGVREGEQVLELLARHPSTARFLARKLCRRFVADPPPPRLVARVAEVFRKTEGDMRQVLSELLHSPEFRQGGAPLLKRPFHFAVSALRALNADTTGAGVLPYLERMGQRPYHWAMPDGYPERMEAWLPGLPARWSFAIDLLRGAIPETRIDLEGVMERRGRDAAPEAVLERLSRTLLGAPPPETLRETLRACAVRSGRRGGTRGEEVGLRQCLALLLASPAFQWR